VQASLIPHACGTSSKVPLAAPAPPFLQYIIQHKSVA